MINKDVSKKLCTFKMIPTCLSSLFKKKIRFRFVLFVCLFVFFYFERNFNVWILSKINYCYKWLLRQHFHLYQKNSRHSIVDAQLQLADLVLTFNSFISYLHAPFAWLSFPLHSTFILPLPVYVQVAIPSAHLSITASLLATQPLPPRGLGVYPRPVPAGYLRLCGQRNWQGQWVGKENPNKPVRVSPYVTSSITRKKTHWTLTTKPCCSELQPQLLYTHIKLWWQTKVTLE